MEKYKVTLTADERYELEQLVRKGKAAARKLAHARILLLADEGDDRTGRPDEQIAETFGVSLRTVSRVRKRFVTEGCQALANAGAFFSRPYGPWADIAFGRCPDTVITLRKLKDIFDPNGIMNPGKLCFGGG